MKKNRHKQNRPSGFTARDNLESKSSSLPSQKIYLFVFFLILLSTVALKIYKADHAGIIYDERANFVIFARSVETAITNYSAANNHVLNSIFMHYANRFFGSYEHFIRIPSICAGIMFSLSIAYIIYKTIKSDALRVASLGLVLFVPFVFDYSYLARGYAFALGGIYTAIAFVLWLLDHKIKFRFWPVPVLIISLMNFLVLGSMLSAVLMVAAFNITFILFCSYRIFRDTINKLKPIILNLVTISLVSLISLFLLYRKIYSKILTDSTIRKWNRWWNGWNSFVNYFHNLLIKKVFKLNDDLGYIILYIFVFILAISLLYYIYKFIISIKAGTWRKLIDINKPASLIFTMLFTTTAIIFIYSIIMKKSLGFQRNQVFIIPIVLISAVIILDRFSESLKKNTFGNITRTIIVMTVVLITLRNLPSPYRISSSTMSKPLLRKLRTIDPNKTWNLAFSKKMESHNIGFMYYWLFDYKFRILREPGGHDIYICRKDERGPGAVCLDWDYYSKVNVAVVVNCKLSDDKVVISARPIEN